MSLISTDNQLAERKDLPPSSAVTRLSVSGMSCANCARHVSDAIQSVPGVRSAAVNLDARRAEVRWSSGGAPDVPAVIQAIQAGGYRAQVIEASAPQTDHADQKLAGWRLNLWVGLPATLALMAGEWVFGLGPAPWFRWLSFSLAAVVQVFAGARFYRGAWTQLQAGRSNMDTLVALGSTTAFAYSVWALFAGSGGHVYFMEAAAIITLISVGHWIESLVSVRASSALRALLNLAPQTARKLRPPGSPGSDEIEVPVAELEIGDRVALRPGDRVPTDGTVLEGNSAVDESMLTGESIPVDKAAGGVLYAGSVNLQGRLVLRVTATGEATALAHIIAAVQRAQASRAHIQRLGDRVSSVFVPVVVAIAAAAGLWWGLAPERAHHLAEWLGRYLWTAHPPAGNLAAAFITAAAVLIVACPCAMGLATPAAIMAGCNAAARRGILIRDGVALEKAGNITAVVFDKTGTLTAGRPTVAAAQTFAIEFAGPLPPAQIRELGAALAALSSHPLSRAIAAASAANCSLTGFRELPGCGTSALVELPPGSGHKLALRLGSLRWLRDEQVGIEPGSAFAAEWMEQGATVLGLSVNNRLAAVYALRDALKPGAPEVIRRLQHSALAAPYRIHLISGDSAKSVHAIARALGIAETRVFAEVRPEQKAAIVRQLQEQGERVAFVGDGINDAPALEQADLGIAVSRASDIAREAADIILLNSGIEAVPESLGLARATLRTIRQNLFWAFFYNAVGVPLAALGFMSPIFCAAAMGFSDLIVIGNALRLRAWKWRAEG
jgi:Cu+-exporting ATPase